MSYTGVIIEESLKDKAVLNQVSIVNTKVEPVTKHHKTPWLKQWTLHSFETAKNCFKSSCFYIYKRVFFKI